jgi:hypothetical protein
MILFRISAAQSDCIRDGADRGRHSLVGIIRSQLPCREYRSRNQNHALAAFFHRDIIHFRCIFASGKLLGGVTLEKLTLRVSSVILSSCRWPCKQS